MLLAYHKERKKKNLTGYKTVLQCYDMLSAHFHSTCTTL